MRWLLLLGLAACDPGRGSGLPEDLGVPTDDLALANDLASANDLAPANDLANGNANDLANGNAADLANGNANDLSTSLDLSTALDFAAPLDFSTAFDLAAPPDLSPTTQHVHLYISNTCVVSTDPPGMTAPLHVPLTLTFHNHSVDYDADVWLSYNGGYLGLAQGAEWTDPVQHCLNPVPYDFYADVSIAGGGSSACPSYRFLVHCQ
jgi:hypothetical protein